jgi:tRNA (cytidine/uridine-2'-O-)-methyltransferase
MSNKKTIFGNRMKDPQLHVVLIEPEIPGNTGNIGRTCVGLGVPLHIVGKIGFKLDDAHLKRAGLDYWPKLQLKMYADWDTFLASLPAAARLYFLSTKGSTSVWDVKFASPAYVIFGSESRGFPPSFYQTYREQLVRIPIKADIRSLNLATAAGVVAFEVARQLQI